MAETDPDKLARDLEHEVDDLERRSKKLQRETEETAQDWQRKRSDENVPGAPPPEDEADKDGEDEADDEGQDP